MNRKIWMVLVIILCPFMAPAAERADSDRGGPPSRIPAGLPDYYPAGFQGQGILREVNLSGGYLMIGADQIAIDPNIRVRTPEFKNATVHVLKPNMAVGYSFKALSNNKVKMINEIWVMPKRSILQH